jgi:lipopolysaccharide/colanic/teichoic acid biosynthesis glycosyltransferase
MRSMRLRESMDRSRFGRSGRAHDCKAAFAAAFQLPERTPRRQLANPRWALLSSSPRSLLLKRSADLVLATTALLLILPLLAVISLLIKIDSRGPVFFRQMRVGARARPFCIYKFRTMVDDAERLKPSLVHLNRHLREHGDPRMFKIPRDPRTTHFGTFLRRYALDELPQLINVIKGEMSLVGPRPLIEEEDRHVTDWARIRLEVRPGITGLWQAQGASEIPFGEMIRLDHSYVTNWSLRGDLRILLETLPAVFRHGDGCTK